jgi:peptidoglycan/LPS O-acetylase OafA/YrhL
MKRIFLSLDILRGIAALAVFFHHYYQQFPPANPGVFSEELFEHLGVWGVTIFFVLSGFCIHWSTVMNRAKAGPFDYKTYFTRRFFRIYPALLVTLLICYPIASLSTSNLLREPSISGALQHMTLVSSFSVEHRSAVNAVLWTVVVECQFYLLYALFNFFFGSPRRTFLITAVAVVIGGATFLASVLLVPQGPVRVMIQHTFAASWWMWCLGACVAEAVALRGQAENTLPARLGLAAAIAVSLGIGFLPGPFSLHAQRFLLPIIAGAGIYCLLNCGGSFIPKPLKQLGDISYSLYLYHPVALWLGYTYSNNALAPLIVFPAGFLLAVLSYRLVESPGNTLGKSFASNLMRKPKTAADGTISR